MVTHSRCPPGPLSRSAELFVSVLLRANRTRGQHDHFASDWRAVVEIDDLPHANAACPPTKPIVLHTRSSVVACHRQESDQNKMHPGLLGRRRSGRLRIQDRLQQIAIQFRPLKQRV